MNPLRLRLLGILLTFLVVFTAVSLGSFSVGDAPDELIYPKSADLNNLFGRPGAWTAAMLLKLFGMSAFFLPVLFSFAAFRLLRGRKIDQVFLRATGLGLVLFGLSGICGLFDEPIAIALQSFRTGPAIGPGGYLGVSLSVLLGRFIAPVGIVALLLSFAAAGTVLLFDRVFPRFASSQNAEVPNNSENDAFGENLQCGLRPNVSENVETGKEVGEIEADLLSEEPLPEPVRGGFMNWLRPSKPNPMQRQSERADRPEIVVEEEEQVESESDEEYRLPSTELLTPPEPFDEEMYVRVVREQAEILEKAFEDFGLDVKVVDIQTGPVISQFELRLAKGLRLNKIQALSDDLAIAMKVPSVRIVAPIPGKNTVGVELPNEHRQMVRLRDVMEQQPDAETKFSIPIYLGKDVSGRPMVIDLAKLPHLLIAGRTGTGKSVCLNSIIVSILMTRGPDQVRMLMIDPKMVELSPYKTIPHLMHPVVTDMRKAEAILGWAVEKMEERYQLLAAAGVRQLREYNRLSEADLRRRMGMEDAGEEEWAAIPKSMPYLVIVADEMADLMMTAGKEVETHIIRLAQKSRAVGIHLVLATQKPTVDIVTGLIKSNLPARIAFGVASRTDSQVVLDKTGAERLLGNGDMLFLKPENGMVVRGQGTYVDDSEIEAIIEAVGTDRQDFVEELVALDPDEMDGNPSKGHGPSGAEGVDLRDELYNEAVEYIIQEGRGSLSLLQRRFSIGYGRAARLIDFMAEDGVVGDYNGSQAREVLMTLGDWRRRVGGHGRDFAQNSRHDAGHVPGAGPKTSAPSSSGRSLRDRVSVRKGVPIKPAVIPTLIDTSNEPRRRPKYAEPVFDDDFDDDEDYYIQGEYD